MPLVFHQIMDVLSDSIAGSFGFSTAISADGKIAVIGASNFGAALGIGAAFYTDLSDAIWQPIQLISDMHEKDFGASISVSEDGKIILVGSPRYTDTFSDQGMVLSVVNGVKSGFLFASDPQTNAFFGASTAISYDGKTAVIGAPGFNSNHGTAYVFIRSDIIWTQQAQLNDSFGSVGDNFGLSVSISANGDTVVIGSPKELISTPGKASVFKRFGTTWTQNTSNIRAFEGSDKDFFGRSVAISADASTIAIGAPNIFNRQGQVDIFVEFDNTWQLQKTLYGFPGSDHFFGESVALSCSGDILLIGAPGEGSVDGSAFFFTRSGVLWSTEAFDIFAAHSHGYSVSLSANGTIAMIGQPFIDFGTARIHRCGYDIPYTPCFCCSSNGTQGPVGPEGPPGPRGSDGATGPQGLQGPAGFSLSSSTNLNQIILFSLMLYGGFLLMFFVITFF